VPHRPALKPKPVKIGVFDSGVGGLRVARAIEAALPEHEIQYANDKKHVPYGTKPLEEIYGYTKPILQKLIDDGCDVIVIACNTVTTNFAKQLRAELSVPLVAVEPMVKPAAALTTSGIIAVCATPRTLSSDRYQWLKQTYAPDVKVLEPDCSKWAALIENNQMNEAYLRRTIEPVLDQGADVIVLACTHYHWIEEEIKIIAQDRAAVLQPEVPLIAQLKRVLAQLA
jgi:glutamate racemase